MTSFSRPSSMGAKRALLQLVCALLLLAQHVGLAHAVWHAAQNLPAQGRTQQAKAARPVNAPAPSDASKLCPLDAAFGQILGAGPASCPQVHAESAAIEARADAPGSYATFHTPAPRSRGPPPAL